MRPVGVGGGGLGTGDVLARGNRAIGPTNPLGWWLYPAHCLLCNLLFISLPTLVGLAAQLPLLAALGLSSLTREQLTLLNNPNLLQQVTGLRKSEGTAANLGHSRDFLPSPVPGDFGYSRDILPSVAPLSSSPTYLHERKPFEGASRDSHSHGRLSNPLPPLSYSPPPPRHPFGNHGYGSQEFHNFGSDQSYHQTPSRGRKLFVKNVSTCESKCLM